MTNSIAKVNLCSNCFYDQGLKLQAVKYGIISNSTCPNCSSTTGRKLNLKLLLQLAHSFFVCGTLARQKYGAAPLIQFNKHQSTCINPAAWFKSDLRLIERETGMGFFHYGPKLWMIGEVEPLKALQRTKSRPAIIERIINEYPKTFLKKSDIFYRIRKDPKDPYNFAEYDSPPIGVMGNGRFNCNNLPVLYGSQDLQVCIHECRVTAEDELYVAAFMPKHKLKLIDLSAILTEENVTEFESLDMAVYMLFLAGKYSYPITRDIAKAAYNAGFDGIIYPSYFSMLRTGGMPFQTTYGLSNRQFPDYHPYERALIISNLALFGRPYENHKIKGKCINKLILTKVEYHVNFGPVGF